MGIGPFLDKKVVWKWKKSVMDNFLVQKRSFYLKWENLLLFLLKEHSLQLISVLIGIVPNHGDQIIKMGGLAWWRDNYLIQFLGPVFDWIDHFLTWVGPERSNLFVWTKNVLKGPFLDKKVVLHAENGIWTTLLSQKWPNFQ